jgi:hypothetical protein
MLAASKARILSSLAPDDLVLDVGGWAQPFPRADWVIDLMPYETRGLYGARPDPSEERYSAATWIARDICAREHWPFSDDKFDFVICSQTLEDVRDPIWVCSELIRVGRAGYIEVPSRLQEQTAGIQGPWVGWGHHHWLIDAGPDGLDFVFKHHIVHGKKEQSFPPGFCDDLAEEEKVETLWWSGTFGFRERIFMEPDELDSYLSDFVASERAARRSRGGVLARWRR